eukprot:Seg998.2 transcript_id=Seg998.2/GoldUCD/mRNA.D3Y31 product="hypothetical protein" protein_id=Seg998.2/GoldUCD/D3Y31
MKSIIIITLVVFTISYANGNWLFDAAKGISEGIEDAFKDAKTDGKDGLQVLKKKFQEKIAEHPKFKHIVSQIKNTELHKKLVNKYGGEQSKEQKEKLKKHLKRIHKWMATLTKNDTDGDAPHEVPFFPKVILRKDKTWGERRKKKAEQIFNKLAKMWERKVKDHRVESKKPFFGSDEKFIQPEFVQQEFEDLKKKEGLVKDTEEVIPSSVTQEFERNKEMFGKDEKYIEPKFVQKEYEKLKKADLFGKDAKKIVPDFSKEEFKRGKNLFGKNEKFIQPKFVNEEYEKQKGLLGKDAKKIIPDFVWDEFEKERKEGSLLGKDEMKIQPDFVKKDFEGMKKEELFNLQKEMMKKPNFDGAEELSIQLLGQSNDEKVKKDKSMEKVKAMINKESEDLEKTVEELLPFLGERKNEQEMKNEDKLKGLKKKEMLPEKVLLTAFAGEHQDKGMKVMNENPSVYKTMEEVKGEEDKSDKDEKEEEIMDTKSKLMADAEKKTIEEQKMFDDAEKMWEAEIQKKALQDIKKSEEGHEKTTEQEEVEEELREPYDDIFTPPDEVSTTVVPELKKLDELEPILNFQFEDKKAFDAKKYESKKEEKIFPVPERVTEPTSIFNSKQPENQYQEMREEVKPFFQEIDDADSRQKFLQEEEEWMKVKQLALKTWFRATRNAQRFKKRVEERKEKEIKGFYI